MHKIILLVSMITMVVSALMAMTFFTISERKFLAYMQYSKGQMNQTL